MFWNGRTAIDGFSGTETVGRVGSAFASRWGNSDFRRAAVGYGRLQTAHAGRFDAFHQPPRRLFGLDSELTLQRFLAGQELAEGIVGLAAVAEDADQGAVGLLGAWVESHQPFGQSFTGLFLARTQFRQQA
ncbi:hypothetical protein GCM10007880_16060 [Mesorhizobium amorphae]|nr:hypothetical protein GCM10007880_16060 [Mesorhizobium amorphae]